MTLQELCDQLLILSDMESSEETDQEFQKFFASIEDDFESKIDAYLSVIREFELLALGAKSEKERQAKREQSFKQKTENLKERLKYAFRYLNKQKVLTATNTVSVYDMKKKTLNIDDVNKLPKKYVTENLVIKPDKDKIKADLNSGDKIDGCIITESVTNCLRIAKG